MLDHLSRPVSYQRTSTSNCCRVTMPFLVTTQQCLIQPASYKMLSVEILVYNSPCRLTVAHANTESDMAEVSRVLRYPDGHVRTIRYPGPGSCGVRGVASMGAQAWPQPPSPPSPEGDWHICSEMDDSCSFDAGFNDDLPGAAPVEELWGARRDMGPARQQRPCAGRVPMQNPQPPVEEFGALPSSPAALLAYLSSDKFASERRKLLDKVAGSYEVLHGCPWLYPRPLLTVAMHKEGQEHPSTYTLPVAAEQVCCCGTLLFRMSESMVPCILRVLVATFPGILAPVLFQLRMAIQRLRNGDSTPTQFYQFTTCTLEHVSKFIREPCTAEHLTEFCSGGPPQHPFPGEGNR